MARKKRNTAVAKVATIIVIIIVVSLLMAQAPILAFIVAAGYGYYLVSGKKKPANTNQADIQKQKSGRATSSTNRMVLKETEHPPMPERLMPNKASIDPWDLKHSPFQQQRESSNKTASPGDSSIQVIKTPFLPTGPAETSRPDTSNGPVSTQHSSPANPNANPLVSEVNPIDDESLSIFLVAGNSELSGAHAIPKAPQEILDRLQSKSPLNPINVSPTKANQGPGRWYRKSDQCQVSDFSFEGLVYIGNKLIDHQGRPDPALINPKLPIAATGDYRIRAMSYWPNYTEITDFARVSYLKWLAAGKNDPDADIGYVFLYFYGIERRLLIDLPTQPENEDEYEIILVELYRLQSIYGQRSKSFRSYCSKLIDFCIASRVRPRLYDEPVPNYEESKELPLILRLQIGQCMADKKPVSLNLVKAWVKTDPSIDKGTYLGKFAEEFFSIFDVLFQEKYPNGLLIPACATRIKIEYRQASSSALTSNFLQHRTVKLALNDVPDIKAVTAPLKKVQEIVNLTIALLEPVKRVLAKQKLVAGSLLYLLFPGKFWPAAAKTIINDLVHASSVSLYTLSGQDLQELFNAPALLTKDQYRTVIQELQFRNIEVEPALTSNVVAPGVTDKIVLFSADRNSKGDPISTEEQDAQYRYASAIIDLAAAVGHADGTFSSDEVRFVNQLIESWGHLSSNDRQRLRAKLRILVSRPLSIPALKDRIAHLDDSFKDAMVKFAAKLVHADGKVSTDEVKFLAKLYKLMGFDPGDVVSDIRKTDAAQVDSALSQNVNSGLTTSPKFQLDHSRIAALQAESDQIAALMNTIFVDEPSNEPVESLEERDAVDCMVADEDARVLSPGPSLLGLDVAHSAFLCVLLERTQWDRAEIDLLAKDLDLMPDGALEKVNEATYEHFDMPLLEGDELLEITVELIEKLKT